MTRSLSLGIDVSTTELRVKVLDLDQTRQVSEAVRALVPVRGADGCREQDADYAQLAVETVARALSEIGDPFQVAAASVTATSGTVVPVDGQGRQSGPAVMYDDARGIPFERELDDGSGRPLSMLGRMMAMAQTRPHFRAASVAQVIGAALVDHPVPGDTSHFLKGGIDPAQAEWPPSLVAAAGLDEETLPELVQPGTTVGRIPSGPAAGALLIAGMTDGCTSQLAAGGVREGDSVGVLGTTLVLKTVSLLDRWDPRSGLYSHRAPDGRFWLGGASNVGGGSIRKPAGLDWAEIDRRARLSGPAQVVSYPLPRRGERFPIADPDFGGFTVDLAQAPAEAPADPVGAYRAALEGVAMVERLALDTLHVDPSVGSRILSGGATRSRLWNEIRAACLGTTVRLPQHSESGYGAAVLAAWGVLGGPFAEAAARFASRSTAFDPEPDLVAAMAERYTVFRGALAVEGATHPKAPTRQGIFNLDPTRREQPLAEEEEHQA